MLEEEREQKVYTQVCNVLYTVSEISDTYELFRKKRTTACDYQGIRAEYVFTIVFKDNRKVSILVQYRGDTFIAMAKNLTTDVINLPLDDKADFSEHLISIVNHFDKWLRKAIENI